MPMWEHRMFPLQGCELGQTNYVTHTLPLCTHIMRIRDAAQRQVCALVQFICGVPASGPIYLREICIWPPSRKDQYTGNRGTVINYNICMELCTVPHSLQLSPSGCSFQCSLPCATRRGYNKPSKPRNQNNDQSSTGQLKDAARTLGQYHRKITI